MANGNAATMPPMLASENVSLPAQPPRTKWAVEKSGATTPMKTTSSKMATSVTTSSTLAAICMPTMFSVMNTRYAPTATQRGSSHGYCTCM